MRTALSAIVVLACLVTTLAAAQAPPKRATRNLSLAEADSLALRRNLRLAAEKINPQRAHTVIIEQQAIFDPITYGELTRSKTKALSATTISGEQNQQAKAVLGIAKLMPPGTTIDLHAGGARDWNDSPFTDINPAYTQEWGATITQPLLRGFGTRVNTAGIATAKNERRIAQATLRNAALETLASVRKTYWVLVFAIRDRALIQRSLDRALNLQRDIQARVDAKVLGERDPAVAQAKAEVAVRQEEIVAANQSIRDAEDSLKVITDIAADPNVWKIGLTPTTNPSPNVPALNPDQAVATAIANRPDYRQAKLLIDNQDIVLTVRRNELLPKLNLSAGVGTSGLGSSWNRAEHELSTVDYYNWSFGLSLEYPLGNRSARARFRRARLEHDQAFINLKALERQIQLEVRNAVRAIATNVERLRATNVSIDAEQERLRAEEIRYKEARVGTIQDVLDAQAALSEAERRGLRALIDLNRSVVDVERLQGTLLDRANVKWEDE